jgi:hypothetical protein
MLAIKSPKMQLGDFILFVTLLSLRDLVGPWGLLLLGYSLLVEKRLGVRHSWVLLVHYLLTLNSFLNYFNPLLVNS